MSCTFLWRCDMVTWNMFAPAGSTGAAKILFKRIHWWFPDGCRLDPGHNSGDQRNKCGLMSTYQNPGSWLTIAIFANTVNSPFLKVLFFADESWGAMLAVVRKLQAIKAASEETQRVSKGTLWWKGFDGIWWLLMSFQLMLRVYLRIILWCSFPSLETVATYGTWADPSNLRLAFVAKLQEVPLVPPLETQLLHDQWCDSIAS